MEAGHRGACLEVVKQAEQVGGRTVIGLGKLNNRSTQIFRCGLLGALYQDVKGLWGVHQSSGYSFGGLLCFKANRSWCGDGK